MDLLSNYFTCNIQHSFASSNYTPRNCLVLYLAEFPVCVAKH